MPLSTFFAKNCAQSFYHNLRCTELNLLGDHGVMGPRRKYEDTRDMPEENTLWYNNNAPFVAVAAAATNIVDGVCSSYF